jgi:hypothetical protein
MTTDYDHPLSVYRGYARSGLGEATGPVESGEQYLHGTAEAISNDKALLRNIGRWLSLDFVPKDQDQPLEAWSCFCAEGSGSVSKRLFVAKLVLAGKYEGRAAYFTHARAWPVYPGQQGFDPGVYLGCTDMFDMAANNIDKARLGDMRRIPETWISCLQDEKNKKAAIQFLGHWLQILESGVGGPLLIGVPLSEFTADSALFKLLAFARAALPTSLKWDCSIRIFTRNPEDFAKDNPKGLVVAPEDVIVNAIQFTPGATLLNRLGECKKGSGLAEDGVYKKYAEATLHHVLEKPAGLLGFSDFQGRDGLSTLRRGNPGVYLHTIWPMYSLAVGMAQHKTTEVFEKVFKSEKLPSDLPWKQILECGDWDAFPPQLLETFILQAPTQPGEHNLQTAVIAALQHRGSKLGGTLKQKYAEGWHPGDAELEWLLDLYQKGLLDDDTLKHPPLANSLYERLLQHPQYLDGTGQDVQDRIKDILPRLGMAVDDATLAGFQQSINSDFTRPEADSLLKLRHLLELIQKDLIASPAKIAPVLRKLVLAGEGIGPSFQDLPRDAEKLLEKYSITLDEELTHWWPDNTAPDWRLKLNRVLQLLRKPKSLFRNSGELAQKTASIGLEEWQATGEPLEALLRFESDAGALANRPAKDLAALVNTREYRQVLIEATRSGQISVEWGFEFVRSVDEIPPSAPCTEGGIIAEPTIKQTILFELLNEWLRLPVVSVHPHRPSHGSAGVSPAEMTAKTADIPRGSVTYQLLIDALDKQRRCRTGKYANNENLLLTHWPNWQDKLTSLSNGNFTEDLEVCLRLADLPIRGKSSSDNITYPYIRPLVSMRSQLDKYRKRTLDEGLFKIAFDGQWPCLSPKQLVTERGGLGLSLRPSVQAQLLQDETACSRLNTETLLTLILAAADDGDGTQFKGAYSRLTTLWKEDREKALTDTVEKIIKAGLWLDWREAEADQWTDSDRRNAALDWLRNPLWQKHGAAPALCLEDWDRAIGDLKAQKLSAADMDALWCDGKRRWPLAEGFEQSQLKDLNQLADGFKARVGLYQAVYKSAEDALMSVYASAVDEREKTLIEIYSRLVSGVIEPIVEKDWAELLAWVNGTLVKLRIEQIISGFDNNADKVITASLSPNIWTHEEYRCRFFQWTENNIDDNTKISTLKLINNNIFHNEIQPTTQRLSDDLKRKLWEKGLDNMASYIDPDRYHASKPANDPEQNVSVPSPLPSVSEAILAASAGETPALPGNVNGSTTPSVDEIARQAGLKVGSIEYRLLHRIDEGGVGLSDILDECQGYKQEVHPFSTLAASLVLLRRTSWLKEWAERFWAEANNQDLLYQVCNGNGVSRFPAFELWFSLGKQELAIAAEKFVKNLPSTHQPITTDWLVALLHSSDECDKCTQDNMESVISGISFLPSSDDCDERTQDNMESVINRIRLYWSQRYFKKYEVFTSAVNIWRRSDKSSESEKKTKVSAMKDMLRIVSDNIQKNDLVYSVKYENTEYCWAIYFNKYPNDISLFKKNIFSNKEEYDDHLNNIIKYISECEGGWFFEIDTGENGDSIVLRIRFSGAKDYSKPQEFCDIQPSKNDYKIIPLEDRDCFEYMARIDSHIIFPVDEKAGNSFKEFIQKGDNLFPHSFVPSLLSLLCEPSLSLRVKRIERIMDEAIPDMPEDTNPDADAPREPSAPEEKINKWLGWPGKWTNTVSKPVGILAGFAVFILLLINPYVQPYIFYYFNPHPNIPIPIRQTLSLEALKLYDQEGLFANYGQVDFSTKPCEKESIKSPCFSLLKLPLSIAQKQDPTLKYQVNAIDDIQKFLVAYDEATKSPSQAAFINGEPLQCYFSYLADQMSTDVKIQLDLFKCNN